MSMPSAAIISRSAFTRPDLDTDPGAGDQQEQSRRHRQPYGDDHQPVQRILDAARQRDRTRKRGWHVEETAGMSQRSKRVPSEKIRISAKVAST